MNTIKKILLALGFVIVFSGLAVHAGADELSSSTPEVSDPGAVSTQDEVEQSTVVGEDSVASREDTNNNEEDSSSPVPSVMTKHAMLHLRVGDKVVFEGEVSVDDSTSVEILDNNASMHTIPFDSVLSVLKKADEESTSFNISDLQYYESFDSFLLNCVEINQNETTEEKCYNWQFVVDGVYPGVGMNAYTVNDGADIYVYFGNPKRVVVEGNEIIAGGLLYARAEVYHYTDDTWGTIPNTVLGIVYADPGDPWTNIIVSTSTTDISGRALFTAPSTVGTYGVGIESDYYYPTSPIDVVDAPDKISVLLRVRSGDTVSIDRVFNLKKGLDIPIIDSYKNEVSIKSESVLNLLEVADNDSDEFDITDIKYYSDFDSFLINCASVEMGATPLCNNWQYVVNNDYPLVGTNAYHLKSGDKVYLYFGNQKRIVMPQVVNVNTSFELTAEKYNYEDGSWLPIEDTVIARVESNPLDPYTPIIVATSTTDARGKAIFSVSAAGEYSFGLASDYYYPLYSVSAVLDSRGGGGGNTTGHKTPNIEKFMSFLDSHQKQDGSFGADLYTDWAAIAYGSTSGHTSACNKLKEYLKSDALGTHPSVTDYERRAMALMALGINPYTGGANDYISPIVASFDGDQFGERDLVNDDVFAIIVLMKAGYSPSSTEILKSRDYIIKSAFDSKGNFESVDIAGAIIQALDPLPETDDSEKVLQQAKDFILRHQKSDGGFSGDGSSSNNSSTSWVLGSLKLVDINVSELINGSNNPFDYITSIQMEDGGIEDGTTPDINSRVWATSYAVVGAQEKAWKYILKSFSKNSRAVSDSGNGNQTEDIANEINPNVPPHIENPTADTPVPTIERILPQTENPVATSVLDTGTEKIINGNIAAVGGYRYKPILWLGSGFTILGVILLIRKWIRI